MQEACFRTTSQHIIHHQVISGNCIEKTFQLYPGLPNMSPTISSQKNESDYASDIEVWTVASRWLTGKNDDIDASWSIVGPHLAKFTSEAGFSIPKQFEVQMFMYSRVIPSLGPPISSKSSSLLRPCLTDNGSPIEYSWKWNRPDNKPEPRICKLCVFYVAT
jgi:hypothetical protein